MGRAGCSTVDLTMSHDYTVQYNVKHSTVDVDVDSYNTWTANDTSTFYYTKIYTKEYDSVLCVHLFSLKCTVIIQYLTIT